MHNNKGVSLISLVITIIIIILIAAISTPLLSSVINDSFEQDAKAELKNVESVIDYARAQVKVEEFTPNKRFVASESELRREFAGVLSEEEMAIIARVNTSSDPMVKYYLMNQERFESEFGNGFNIKNIRSARYYLVNYYYGTIVTNYEGKKFTNANPESIIPAETINRGDITVTITPNGNSNWMRIQNVSVAFYWEEEVNSVSDVSFVWTESISQPSDDEFINTFSGVTSGSSHTTNIDSKTGNGWYLWLKINYKEKQTQLDRTKYVRSEAFYLDNTPPSAELEVNEIN